MSTEDTVNQIITSGRAEADKLVRAAIGFADDAQMAAETVIVKLSAGYIPNAPNIPTIAYYPGSDLSTDFLNMFDASRGQFSTDFGNAFQFLMNTYFPSVAGCLQPTIDNWLCNAINNGGTGLPPAIEAAIWQRSREREVTDSRRQKAETLRGWAAKGFSYPPGALISLLDDIDQDLANKNSTNSRDIAIKNVEIQIENIRFAIQNGIQLRISALAAALDYIKVFFLPTELAEKKAAAMVEAKAELWRSADSYFGALISAEQLNQKYQEMRMEKGMHDQKMDLEAIKAQVDARVKAAVSSAEAMASAASSALSAQVSLGQLAYQQVQEA